MHRVELIQFASDLELVEGAATRWLDRVRAAAHAGRNLFVALSGGRIAKEFFTAIAKKAGEHGLTPDHVDFFWADERCVPPDDPDSNFLLAKGHLLDPLGVPEAKVHRIRGELTPSSAARRAAVDLARLVPANNFGVPVLDLVLLGMGEDGHVASLFPGNPDSDAASPDLFLAVTGPKPPPRRISLGYGPIAAAREVWVLASGPGKENALNESISCRRRSPLAIVIESRPWTCIFTDIPAR